MRVMFVVVCMRMMGGCMRMMCMFVVMTAMMFRLGMTRMSVLVPMRGTRSTTIS